MWRISVGTLALAALAIPAMQISAHIAYKYSVRRKVGAPNPVPIISFRTQQIPVFNAVAQTYVLEAWLKHATRDFTNPSASHQERHAIATIWKATVMEQVSMIVTVISEDEHSPASLYRLRRRTSTSPSDLEPKVSSTTTRSSPNSCVRFQCLWISH